MKTPAPQRAAGRQALARKGHALSDGSFPIPNVDYLHKALRAVGRAPASKRPALARLIRKRAKQLRAQNVVKGTWADPAKSMSNAYDLASGPAPYRRSADETVECPSCGKYNAPDARYCDQCGAKLPSSAFASLASQNGALEMANRRLPINTPEDILVMRGDGAAIIRHRRGGEKIGEISHNGNGWVAQVEGGGETEPFTHQRTALLRLIGTWNRGTTTAERPAQPLQPEPRQSAAMAALGIPATRPMSLATPTVGASDGPRVTTSGSNGGESLAGLTPKGVTIYKRLRGKGFPAARALKFARRAQSFGK